jgi:hypothetical protein
MPDALLSQEEAEALLAMEKVSSMDRAPQFPTPGTKIAVPLRSHDGRETFLLDVSRARIKLTKATFQNRAKQVVVLARVDIDGPSHRNPDGVEIPCPHLHVYREGFGDKWAQPLPPAFTNANDLWQTFEDFCRFCNIIGSPVEQGLHL